MTTFAMLARGTAFGGEEALGPREPGRSAAILLYSINRPSSQSWACADSLSTDLNVKRRTFGGRVYECYPRDLEDPPRPYQDLSLPANEL